jgi:hypothetical protein
LRSPPAASPTTGLIIYKVARQVSNDLPAVRGRKFFEAAMFLAGLLLTQNFLLLAAIAMKNHSTEVSYRFSRVCQILNM